MIYLKPILKLNKFMKYLKYPINLQNYHINKINIDKFLNYFWLFFFHNRKLIFRIRVRKKIKIKKMD
jgi:hypothetical protein